VTPAPRLVVGPPQYATVPRAFPGATIVCVGTGPSLRRADVDACLAAECRVVAINDAYREIPEADVLFAADRKWYDWHQGAPDFTRPKYCLERTPYASVRSLRRTGHGGLELAPDGLRTGYTSGYSAINLAVHLGAARILLLGYDMQRGPRGEGHAFGEHRDGTVPPFDMARTAFALLVDPLEALGVAVVNVSRVSSISAFPRAALEDVLPREVLR